MLVVWYVFSKNNTQSKTVSLAPALSIAQLKNATVPDFTSDITKNVTLLNGHYNVESRSIVLDTQEHAYASANLIGDEGQDIVAILSYSGGGSGIFDLVTVFENNNGMPKYIDAYEFGDRQVINNVTVKEGVISIDYITQGPGDPMCCGTLHKVSNFKLVDGKLVELKN